MSTTAINALDRIGQVLVAAGRAPDPPLAFADESGTVRLEVPFPRFGELVALAFDGFRTYGATTPAVAIHMARVLSQLLATLPPERHAPLRREAARLAEVARAVEPETARREVLAAIEPLV